MPVGIEAMNRRQIETFIASEAIAVGDTVAKGDIVVVLEAMKMENMLKAEQEGTVKSVNVFVGDAVEKNNVLIEFE